MTDPDTPYMVGTKCQSCPSYWQEYHGKTVHEVCVLRNLEGTAVVVGEQNCPMTPEAREIVEAVIGGEHHKAIMLMVNMAGPPMTREELGERLDDEPTPDQKDLPTFADMKGIYADKPCSTCGGRIENVFHIGCGNRLECVDCGKAKGD